MSRGGRFASPALVLSTRIHLLFQRQFTRFPQHICIERAAPSNILYFVIDFQKSLCYTQADSKSFVCLKLGPQKPVTGRNPQSGNPTKEEDYGCQRPCLR